MRPFFRLVALLVTASAPSFSQAQSHGVLDPLRSRIEESLIRLDGGEWGHDDFLVDSINELYLKLDRSRVPMEEVLEAKYATMAWRSQVKRRLTEVLTKESVNALERTRIQETLAKLGISLDSSPRSEKSGPGAMLGEKEPRFVAIEPTKGFNHLEWVKKFPAAYANLDVNPTTWETTWRGVTLRPGDLLLVNQALPFDGLFTAFMEPRQNFTHTGVFVVIPHQADGKEYLIPAVMETYKFGLRAVPLHQFVAGHFNRYIEAYRSTCDIIPDPRTLATNVLKTLAVPFRYDFRCEEFSEKDLATWPPEEKDDRHIICTINGDIQMRLLGVPSTEHRTTVPPGGQANLIGFENPLTSILTSQDFLRSDRFRLVGWFDNDRLEDILVTEYLFGGVEVEGTLGYKLAREKFVMSDLETPPAIAALETAHQQLGQASVDFAARVAEGFPAGTFPRGSFNVLKAIMQFDKANAESFGLFKEAYNVRSDLDSRRVYSLRETESSEGVRSARKAALKKQSSWFVPRLS